MVVSSQTASSEALRYSFPYTSFTSGFTEVGQLLILDPQMILNYTYNSRDDTFNGRTIQKFSLSAKEEMYTCQQNCPYSDFTKFVKYYGEFDYGDQWIQAAFEKKSTNFENGNMDFSVADRGGVEGTCYSCIGAPRLNRSSTC